MEQTRILENWQSSSFLNSSLFSFRKNEFSVSVGLRWYKLWNYVICHQYAWLIIKKIIVFFSYSNKAMVQRSEFKGWTANNLLLTKLNRLFSYQGGRTVLWLFFFLIILGNLYGSFVRFVVYVCGGLWGDSIFTFDILT